MVPSVLIVAEDMNVLLACYSNLHQDARMGRVEAVTSRFEAAKLVQTFQPHVLVLDASAAGSAGLGAAIDDLKLQHRPKVVVTCDERDGPAVAREARAIGATGVMRRESVSAKMILRACAGPGARPQPAAAAV